MSCIQGVITVSEFAAEGTKISDIMATFMVVAHMAF